MKQQLKVVCVHEDEGFRTGIQVGEGPKWVQIIWPDSAGIKIRKLPKTRELKLTELNDYRIERAKKILRKCGVKFGITKSARKALRVGA